MTALRRLHGSRGDSGPLEMVILLPAVLLLFGLVVAFGRTTTAATNVEHAAAVGARAAVAAQTAGGAGARANVVVSESLAGSGLSCRSQDTSVSGSFTARRPGHRHGVVRGRPRRRHPVRLPPGITDPDGVGDRGDRPHARRCADVGPAAAGSRGSVSLLVVIMVPALLMAAGLVLDGGRQLQARRDAGAAAAAAGSRRHPAERTGALRHRARHRARHRSGQRRAGGSGRHRLGRRRRPDGRGDRQSQVDYLILPGGRTVSTSSSSTPLHGVTAGGAVSERVFERANHQAPSSAHWCTIPQRNPLHIDRVHR